MLRAVLSRILGTSRRRQMDVEFDDELSAHLEMLEARFIARGMDPAEAFYAARRQFGGVTQVREDLRQKRSWLVFEGMAQEVRHAFRQLGKAKGFTAAAALTLALGIGATTTVFAVLDAVVLRPLPFAGPDKLMAFRSVDQHGTPHHLSYPDFFDFRKQNQVFENLVSYRDERFTLSGSSLPSIQVVGEIVSWDLFPMLGIQPALGRGFLPEEEKPGTNVVVLSHTLWRNRFGEDKAILGQAIRINDTLFTVIGVTPAGFQFPADAPAVELWTTVCQDANVSNQRGGRMLDAIGRLKSDVTVMQAQAQMDLVAGALAAQYPGNRNLPKTIVMPELERMGRSSRKPLFILLGAVAMLLLIACANVANLLLARSAERAREFSVRTALGASRPAIIRQVLVESLVLGILGAVGGIALAKGALNVILPLIAESLPRALQAAIDARVLAFSIAVALLTSVLFSLAPAVQAAAADPARGLKEGARNIARGHDRFRSALVVLQITLGLVLLTGAQFLMASFMHLTQRDPGFRSDHLLTFGIGLSEAQRTVSGQIAFSGRMLEGLKAIPGVQTAAAGRPLPLQGNQMRIAFDIESRPADFPNRPKSNTAIVTPGYFGAMGIPLLKGRDFSERDDAGSPPVLVVNEAFARKFFPGENVIGKRIQPGAGPTPVMREIAGVVGNAKQALLSADPDPIYYFPYKQLPWGIGTVVLRTAVPPMQIEPAVRSVLKSLDQQAPMYEVRTGEELAAAAMTGIRFQMVLMGSFAAFAVLLTGAGLYGVLSYAVAKRRREIGVRIALGAGRAEVLALVFRQAMRLVAIGLVLGLGCAMAGGRLMGAMVHGIRPGDPMILTGACLVLVITGMAAAYLPAMRAASVDPMQALRSE